MKVYRKNLFNSYIHSLILQGIKAIPFFYCYFAKKNY